MLTPAPVVEKLNEQIANEFHAAHNYMAMACRFDELGLKMLAQWFFRQGEEERDHGKKILHYLLEVGADVKLRAIGEPVGDSEPARSRSWRPRWPRRRMVTEQIHNLFALAEEHRDYATRSFLAWFVDEQVEEVATMTELLQMLKLAGDQHLLQVEARVSEMLSAPADGG
jgi:ferritin